MKIVLYNSSARGSGQFARSVKIARILNEEFETAQIRILAGNSIISKVIPRNTEIVEIPQVRKAVNGDYVTENNSLEDTFTSRHATIENYLSEFRPDYFLVDSRPLGLRDELSGVLQKQKERNGKSVLLLRDIIDDPDKVKDQWRAAGWYKAVDNAYDHIWILGEEHLYDAVSAYALEHLRSKIRYMGYLKENKDQGRLVNSRAKQRIDTLVTVGGGHDGHHLILEFCTYLDQKHPEPEKSTYTIVLGANSRLTPDKVFARTLHVSDRLSVYQHVIDLDPLIQQADVVISMGGYNSMTELVAQQKKIVVVPRPDAGFEQVMRAELFAAVYDGIWLVRSENFQAKTLQSILTKVRRASAPTNKPEFRAKNNITEFFYKDC